ncbi:MAG: murein biosynthesis integral membrane protein MurJ [Candidatus Abawacabacteria bacterium RIFCSPHIGHO2_01_FULL_46_8]|uniref:Probable lipid II flippase MurJ n=1 Tax=Candidatus Abawacabacteria bacterium RIFCSPHIGHO2_01_FULL_46_8 TaxID=1817815 RepID=A0A1F4XL23_9BACT|nr:MAG: murein biosynthesis integral membrane protein MurJ [Candidatus Abawacabacteria bacterium RIFCSPHIGHO2_01_FULL_46_8]
MRDLTRRFAVPAAVLLGVSSFFSRILGVVRDHLLTNEFGATRPIAGAISELDTYYAAFRIPDFIYNLLILGTISAVFIPVFTALVYKDKEEAWRLTATIINLLVIILLGVTFFAAIFTPYIIKAFTLGFDEASIKLTVSLTRVMLLSPLLFGLSAVASSVLNTFKKFWAIALSPIFYNLGILVGIVFLVPKIGIFGVAIGVIIGAFLHLAVQLPALHFTGFSYQPIIEMDNPRLRKMARLIVPRILALSTTQINLVINTIIGSTLIAGSITILNLADNLQSLPAGIIGVSVAIATFSTFAELASTGNKEGFVTKLSETLRSVLFLIVPAAMGMILLRAELVRLILGSGKFNWTDTVLTANTLGFFCIGLFAASLIPVLARAFYAYQDTKTPLMISFFALVMNVVLSLALTKWLDFGVAGLALALSLANIIAVTLLFLSLKTKLGDNLDSDRILLSALKIIFCTVVMAGFVQVTKTVIGSNVDMTTFLGVFLKTFGSTIVGALTYLAVAKLLRCDELKLVFRPWREQQTMLKPHEI